MKVPPVADAMKAIIGSGQKASGTPSIQGVLAARHGKLVLEEYFYGFDQARLHDLRSVGNCITSTLVGIAIDQGAPFGLSSPVYPLFTGYEAVANPDPRKARITVQDLLTMTSGLAGNDKDPSSPGNELRLLNDPANGADFYKATLDLPMAADPGGPVGRQVHGRHQSDGRRPAAGHRGPHDRLLRPQLRRPSQYPEVLPEPHADRATCTAAAASISFRAMP